VHDAGGRGHGRAAAADATSDDADDR
jgi:hypothetical protein